ncbi:MAG TPA: SAF domain-containing protein [Microlunatus sp.]|nr:SAF domain-containing protein [Microlunatus sp.]
MASRANARPSPRQRNPAQRPTARQWSVDFRRALRRHRRKLALLATLAAVLTGLTALAPPGPATQSVVTAARLLPAGSTITADDLARTALPDESVPDGAVADPTELIGRKVAGPVPAKQVLTASSLLRNRAAGGRTVVAPLPLADDRVSGLLEAGDVVDVLAAETDSGKTRVVASAVRVVTAAIGETDTTSETGGLVLVEVSPDTAAELAGAASTSVLSVVWR